MRYFKDIVGMFGSGSDKMLSLHFAYREFKCKCNRKECDAPDMDKHFVGKLQLLRHKFGKPIPINSGARCKYWNAAVGGSPRSMHLLGKAADLRFESIEDRECLAVLAKELGFGGIGKALTFLHVDIGPDREWTY